MEAQIVLCSACGARNRISDFENKKQPLCGKCKKSLHVKGNNFFVLSSFWALFANLWYVWALLFFFVILPLFESDSGYSGTSHHSYEPAKIEEITFTELPVHINHGVVIKNFSNGAAPLEIRTKYGQDYYIKVMNALDDRLVLTAYINGGRAFNVNLPLGTYEIRYASGDTWYGPEYYFGPKTVFSKADDLFDFTFNGYQYSGYTVELIMQAYGNLETTKIGKADF